MIAIDVLGSKYTIHIKNPLEDPRLKDCDGYTDITTRKIVITGKPEECDLEDIRIYQLGIMQREIIKAFMSESGLIPKMLRAFLETEVIYIKQKQDDGSNRE